MTHSPTTGTSEPARVQFADPHATTGPHEAEVTRVRRLTGFWRWLLVGLTAATIFLCINQQFTLRFFVGYTQLNTEYFYLLIVLMLPFTFLIFPGGEKAPLDRVPWYDVALFIVTIASGIYLMLNIRSAAELGWEFTGAPPRVIGAGLVMWFVLMEALRRTGGWSLLLSVLPFTLYPLIAESKWLGPLRGTQSTLEQATAYHVLSTESLLGIPIQAFAETVIGFLVFGTALMMTGAGKFFINLAFALCGTFRGGAAKVGIFASALLGIRHDDDTDDEEDRILAIVRWRHRGVCINRRRAGASGDGRDSVRDRTVSERVLCRGGACSDHTGDALLHWPFHAG